MRAPADKQATPRESGAEDVLAPLTAADSPLVSAIVPAVNFEARRNDLKPRLLVMHYTGMASADRAIYWLGCSESRVSCHYVVDLDGRVTQMVAEAHRAWHAGQSSWSGETDINSQSIGIEIQNPGHEDGYHDFPEAQMNAVLRLSQDIIARHDIAPDGVVAHSDIAPGRKIDPGEKFDWEFLARNGVGLWVEPVAISDVGPAYKPGDAHDDIAEVQQQLRQYGYGITETGSNDPDTTRVTAAFQRHFRPARVDGVIDGSTRQTLRRLIKARDQLPKQPAPLVG